MTTKFQKGRLEDLDGREDRWTGDQKSSKSNAQKFANEMLNKCIYFGGNKPLKVEKERRRTARGM